MHSFQHAVAARLHGQVELAAELGHFGKAFGALLVDIVRFKRAQTYALYAIDAAYRVRRERWVQRKDYKFFTCPSCRTTLRVPRGKGQIRIVCRKCGNTFTGKT